MRKKIIYTQARIAANVHHIWYDTDMTNESGMIMLCMKKTRRLNIRRRFEFDFDDDCVLHKYVALMR